VTDETVMEETSPYLFKQLVNFYKCQLEVDIIKTYAHTSKVVLFFTIGNAIKYSEDATGLYRRYDLFIIYFTSFSYFLYLKCINMLYNAQTKLDLCSD